MNWLNFYFASKVNEMNIRLIFGHSQNQNQIYSKHLEKATVQLVIEEIENEFKKFTLIKRHGSD